KPQLSYILQYRILRAIIWCRRKVLELKDNLTTLFQLQERNIMLLNSLIIAVAILCEPFVTKTKKLDDFVERVAKLTNF
ncbi:unnamed protein product, partial [Didymodactylos carnosus]